MSAFMATAPVGWPADLPGPSVLGFLACAVAVRRDAFLGCGPTGKAAAGRAQARADRMDAQAVAGSAGVHRPAVTRGPRDPAARRAVAELIARLPRALARWRSPDPAVPAG